MLIQRHHSNRRRRSLPTQKPMVHCLDGVTSVYAVDSTQNNILYSQIQEKSLLLDLFPECMRGTKWITAWVMKTKTKLKRSLYRQLWHFIVLCLSLFVFFIIHNQFLLRSPPSRLEQLYWSPALLSAAASCLIQVFSCWVAKCQSPSFERMQQYCQPYTLSC